MWILQTDKTVLVGDEIELATQLLDLLKIPLSPDRLRHLAVAMTGCRYEEVEISKISE